MIKTNKDTECSPNKSGSGFPGSYDARGCFPAKCMLSA